MTCWNKKEFCFQVPFFLFIIFTVYTMLPFQLWHAVVLSIISSLSHILVLTVRLTMYKKPTPYLANQVRLVILNLWYWNVGVMIHAVAVAYTGEDFKNVSYLKSVLLFLSWSSSLFVLVSVFTSAPAVDLAVVIMPLDWPSIPHLITFVLQVSALSQGWINWILLVKGQSDCDLRSTHFHFCERNMSGYFNLTTNFSASSMNWFDFGG